MTASELYKAGKLDEAIAAQNDVVKKKPTDLSARWFLSELLSFAGNFDRADANLDAIMKLAAEDPATIPTIALFRHLLRAEQARQQLWSDGLPPEFLTEPSPGDRLYLEAIVLMRAGQKAEAFTKLEEAENQRPKRAGKFNDQAFDDFRDIDDTAAGHFEVLTSTGKYYWIPLAKVESIDFDAPERPRDLIWRQARMVVTDGPDGVVYLPCLYSGSSTDPDVDFRLGRKTDWFGEDNEPVRGKGQRSFLVGEEARTILEAKSIAFQT